MKRILPSLFICSLLLLQAIFFTAPAMAQTPTLTPVPTTPTDPQGTLLPTPVPEVGEWIEDPTVTFVGKMAARSGHFLDWALRTYDYASFSSDGANPLLDFWVIIRNIVYAFLVLFVLISAFVVIITRGRSLTIKKFIPRFLGIVILVTLSFALLQFLYQVTDVIQGFFLRNPDPSIPNQTISQRNLLSVAFPYEQFVGYRRFDMLNNESAFMSLLLVKLTAATYYVMVGVLLLRKIILWFFIVISPVFSLLLLYYPVRNTAKIWIGEFFRWLLYAPLFAIFLSGLVAVWRTGIPMKFSFSDVGTPDKVVYPTAINILLGGPGQVLEYNNTVNLPDTFALYVVALIMLWVVILLPFILLQIFLDYFHNFNFADNTMIRQLINTSNTVLNKTKIPSPPPPSIPPPATTGMARSIPVTARVTIPAMKPAQYSPAIQRSSEILRLSNLSIPTMRDIARFETASLSRDTRSRETVTKMHETLDHIANPHRITTPQERSKYVAVRQKLLEEKQKGNPVATSILSAAHSTTSAVASAQGTGPQETPTLPTVNRVQSVNLDDYEAVKRMWQENYRNLETPAALGIKDRKEWIKRDQDKITLAVNLLLSQDVLKKKQAMQMVGQILPFLLIGGFSQTEVIAYLKAKLEAGKGVLEEIETKEKEEESLLPTQRKVETQKTMSQSVQIEDEKSKQAQGEPKKPASQVPSSQEEQK